ncbi:MAG: hypothetical protein Q8Q31_05810 [Nanoarchaeota archaeon]|nr:hypothetical protein [Nanoarchaeota archaeon]
MSANLNKPGNLIHTVNYDRLTDIVAYGLVSQYHHWDWTTMTQIHGMGNRCPCEQELSQGIIDQLNNRGLLFFHSIGAKYKSGRGTVSVTNLEWPVSEERVGILIEPKDFLKGVPEESEYELSAFQGDPVALEKIAIKRYWEEKEGGAIEYGRGNARNDPPWEFRIPSCIPWKKFSAFVVSPKKKKQRVSHLISLMSQLRPSELKPIFDISGDPQFSPGK